MITWLAAVALAVETEEGPPAEPPPPAAAPAEPPANEDLEALRADLAATQKRLDELQKQIADTRLALIPKDTLKLTFEGHYRTRASMYGHLFASQTDAKGDHDTARLMTHQLLLRPKLDFRDVAKFWTEFRALDDVVWGDNASLASTAVFAGSPSNTGLDGVEEPTVTVARAWLEANVAVGVLRVGRQPSQWGMGLLANSGDRLDQDFGDSHYPTTSDRVLFATRPFAIAHRISGKGDPDIPLIAAIGVDRLVEDPLIQFHGFECPSGPVTSDDPEYDLRCDVDGDGVTDQTHSWVDDTRTAEQRGDDWWADPDDDVQQMVYVLAYRGENVRYWGRKGELTAGVYAVNRRQTETSSKVWVVDGHVHLKNRGFLADAEAIAITGDTRGITLPSTGPDPLAKEARLWGYVARVGYERPMGKLAMEVGFASGDENVSDETFSGRPLHPDHNVGLLLYEEVLSRVTANGWTESARGLWSNGGVYNSRYVFPTVTVTPGENWKGVVGLLTAWPDKPDGAVIRCHVDDRTGCALPASEQATARSLGWEIDAMLSHTWYEHLSARIEAGYLHATDRIPLEAAGLDPKGRVWTLQSRIAYTF